MRIFDEQAPDKLWISFPVKTWSKAHPTVRTDDGSGPPTEKRGWSHGNWRRYRAAKFGKEPESLEKKIAIVEQMIANHGCGGDCSLCFLKSKLDEVYAV